jgi:hypothetical protein
MFLACSSFVFLGWCDEYRHPEAGAFVSGREKDLSRRRFVFRLSLRPLRRCGMILAHRR